MRYQAIEVLKKAGVKNPAAKIGKMSVSIGGIAVNKPDHVINFQDAKTVEVIVGAEKFEASL